MKITCRITLIALLFSTFTFAQQITIKKIESRLVTHQGVEFVGELKDKSSDIYTFSDWNNKGIIFINGKQYLLSNINFNVTTNKFDSRVKRDELFCYKNSEIDSISINNLMFKNIGNSFYEVLYEQENSLFLKKHDLKYKAGVVNRLDGVEGSPLISKKFRYLVKIGDNLKQIELNKKSVLSLVDSVKKVEIEKFAKEEHLSYKKEKDVTKIIEYMLQHSSIIS